MSQSFVHLLYYTVWFISYPVRLTAEVCHFTALNWDWSPRHVASRLAKLFLFYYLKKMLHSPKSRSPTHIWKTCGYCIEIAFFMAFVVCYLFVWWWITDLWKKYNVVCCLTKLLRLCSSYVFLLNVLILMHVCFCYREAPTSFFRRVASPSWRPPLRTMQTTTIRTPPQKRYVLIQIVTVITFLLQ